MLLTFHSGHSTHLPLYYTETVVCQSTDRINNQQLAQLNSLHFTLITKQSAALLGRQVHYFIFHNEYKTFCEGTNCTEKMRRIIVYNNAAAGNTAHYQLTSDKGRDT